MDYNTWGLILFVIVFAGFLVHQRHRLFIQRFGFKKSKVPIVYLALLRTKVGLTFMDFMATRFSGFLGPASTFGIFIGFLGMLFVSVEILWSTVKLLTSPVATGAAALVLPIEAKGVVYVPFLIWIISLAIIVTVHEFGHGIIARLYKIPIKSTGLAAFGVVLPFLPAAFVEPDEKKMAKRPAKQQLAVFAAGPFANILLAFLLLPLLVFATSPAVDALYDYQGVKINDITDNTDYPVTSSGLPVGALITQLDGEVITKTSEFTQALSAKSAGDTVTLLTTIEGAEQEFAIALGENPNKAGAGYLGVVAETVQELKNPTFANNFLVWLHELVMWLLILNLGIGLFNLLPVGIVDGGRMIKVALDYFLKESHATAAYATVSAMCLFVVLFGVVANFMM